MAAFLTCLAILKETFWWQAQRWVRCSQIIRDVNQNLKGDYGFLWKIKDLCLFETITRPQKSLCAVSPHVLDAEHRQTRAIMHRHDDGRHHKKNK